MKFLIVLILLASSNSSFASDYTCQAYCGFYSANPILIYTDTNGEFVVATESTIAKAYNKIKKACRSIDSKYSLYTDTRHTGWATPSNSCR